MILNPDQNELSETENEKEVEPGDQPSEMANAQDGQADQADTESSTESADSSEPEPESEDQEADVTFDGNRPIVQELHYKQQRPKAAEEDEQATEELRFSSVSEAKAVVEGFLFSSNEPLSVARLSKLMGDLHPKTVRGLLLELQWEYENRPGALQVVEIAGGYQMATRPYVAPWMFRLHKLKRRSPLSPATLETLAIIAYRQPITKGEIEGIRGVETGAPLRTLQELGLIEPRGRREVIGRPQLYVTTEQFLKVFGLKSIADLPSISELKSRFAEEQRLKPQIAKTEPEQPASELEQTASETHPEDSNSDEPAPQPDDQTEGHDQPADTGQIDPGEDFQQHTTQSSEVLDEPENPPGN